MSIKIYVVGSTKNKFLQMNSSRQKFFVDESHTGDNIDNLNPWYCELTGMYYMWKHETADIVGLEHYRRNFIGNSGLLTDNEIENILKSYDVILYRDSVKSNAMQHMLKAYKGAELALGLAVINTEYGKEMSDFFYKNFIGDYVYLGNMFICKKTIADKYFEFIFNVLKEFDEMHQFKIPRIDGYIAEYFMEPWFEYMNYKIYNCNRQVMDKELTKKLPDWA